jgi:cyclic beta-1,2-glucan synthetase
VIANASFGFQVSEAGAGYTWAVNSRLHQVTPWSNDPVTDPCFEHYLLQDLDTQTLLPLSASRRQRRLLPRAPRPGLFGI